MRHTDRESLTTMHRITVALAAAATLVPAATAQAGTVTLDKACYVEQQDTMVVTGTGFTPGASLTLSGDGAFATATADASGGFQVPVQAPINPSIDASPASVVTYTLRVQDAANPAQSTQVQYQVTNFAVSNGAAARSPHAKRTWRFIGFPTGSTIYGHYRFKGRTRGTQRFGTATGPCGALTVRAAGLPRSIRPRTGTWTLQVDGARRYSSRTRPAWIGRFPIYVRFR